MESKNTFPAANGFVRVVVEVVPVLDCLNTIRPGLNRSVAYSPSVSLLLGPDTPTYRTFG